MNMTSLIMSHVTTEETVQNMPASLGKSSGAWNLWKEIHPMENLRLFNKDLTRFSSIQTPNFYK